MISRLLQKTSRIALNSIMEKKSVFFRVGRAQALQHRDLYCSPYIIWVIRQEWRDWCGILHARGNENTYRIVGVAEENSEIRRLRRRWILKWIFKMRLQNMDWIAEHGLNYRTWTEIQNTDWITEHGLNYRTWTELQNMDWITEHGLNYRTLTDLQNTDWITEHGLNYRTWTELQNIDWIHLDKDRKKWRALANTVGEISDSTKV